MNDKMNTAIQAINKWVFFGWNYSCVQHQWKGACGEIKTAAVPQFLAEVKWSCNFDHMFSKWKEATHNQNPNAYLVRFYAELGIENRQALIEWVMLNYNDEQRINSQAPVEDSQEAQTLAKIREWAENIPVWLSNREGYAQGYREGMIRAHKIVLSMITGEPFEE